MPQVLYCARQTDVETFIGVAITIIIYPITHFILRIGFNGRHTSFRLTVAICLTATARRTNTERPVEQFIPSC